MEQINIKPGPTPNIIYEHPVSRIIGSYLEFGEVLGWPLFVIANIVIIIALINLVVTIIKYFRHK